MASRGKGRRRTSQAHTTPPHVIVLDDDDVAGPSDPTTPGGDVVIVSEHKRTRRRSGATHPLSASAPNNTQELSARGASGDETRRSARAGKQRRTARHPPLSSAAHYEPLSDDISVMNGNRTAAVRTTSSGSHLPHHRSRSSSRRHATTGNGGGGGNISAPYHPTSRQQSSVRGRRPPTMPSSNISASARPTRASSGTSRGGGGVQGGRRTTAGRAPRRQTSSSRQLPSSRQPPPRQQPPRQQPPSLRQPPSSQHQVHPQHDPSIVGDSIHARVARFHLLTRMFAMAAAAGEHPFRLFDDMDSDDAPEVPVSPTDYYPNPFFANSYPDSSSDDEMGAPPSWFPPPSFAFGLRMSYEDLLALDEHNVRVGLNKQQLDAYTITQTLTKNDADKFKDKDCVICLDGYEEGNVIRRLPCLCVFHTQCIDRHLSESKQCPICRSEVDVAANQEPSSAPSMNASATSV